MLESLRRWIARGHRRRSLRPQRPDDAWLRDAAEVVADHERPLGCGWFDSSHELRAGLMVREHASADAVANELPLGDWLQLHLVEWRGLAANGHH